MTPQSNLGCFHGGVSSKNQEKNTPRAKLPHTPQQDRKQITLSQQKLVYQEKKYVGFKSHCFPLKKCYFDLWLHPKHHQPPRRHCQGGQGQGIATLFPEMRKDLGDAQCGGKV